jgi:hypothetical protein
MLHLPCSRALRTATLIALTACTVASAQTTTKHTCHRLDFSPSPADDALGNRNYAEAERLYTADLAAAPASTEAMAGLVRTSLAANKLTEALERAQHFDTAHPNDAALIDALGAVRFRRGEVADAATAFNRSMQLDPCNPRTHLDEYLYFNFSGMRATSQQQLDMAHTLMPDNPAYGLPWQRSHAPAPTQAETIEAFKKRLADPKLTDDQRKGLTAAIAGIETRAKGNCELVSPVAKVKLQLYDIETQSMDMVDETYGVGIDVQLNGKKKRLEVDTGASGLLLSHAAAISAGLTPEMEARVAGIGNGGAANSFVTHVDDIRIGALEFKNCMVTVLEQTNSPTHVLEHTDGLIGTDVFRDYLVTLDTPGRELRIEPLPKRPDDKGAVAVTLNTTTGSNASGLTTAETAKDRYIAPEMKDWTPIYRSGHLIFVPASVGNAPIKLMLIDSGSAKNFISPEIGRDVSHVAADYDTHIIGVSGQVKNVYQAKDVSITFANINQMTHFMTAIDTSFMGHPAGAEISGLIGFPMLRELILTIDYRDNLIHVVYDKKKGLHGG